MSKFYKVKSERLVSPKELLDELKDSDNLKSIDFIPSEICGERIRVSGKKIIF